MVLVVAGLVATSLAVFALCGPVTRGADMNAWPESRIVYPGARLVATATKDKVRPSWLDGNDYNAAELIKSYEVDISVPSGSIVTYYSRQLAALGWHDSTEVTTRPRSRRAVRRPQTRDPLTGPYRSSSTRMRRSDSSQSRP